MAGKAAKIQKREKQRNHCYTVHHAVVFDNTKAIISIFFSNIWIHLKKEPADSSFNYCSGLTAGTPKTALQVEEGHEWSVNTYSEMHKGIEEWTSAFFFPFKAGAKESWCCTWTWIIERLLDEEDGRQRQEEERWMEMRGHGGDFMSSPSGDTHQASPLGQRSIHCQYWLPISKTGVDGIMESQIVFCINQMIKWWWSKNVLEYIKQRAHCVSFIGNVGKWPSDSALCFQTAVIL